MAPEEKKSRENLLKKLDHDRGEYFSYDLWLGLAGCGGAVYLAVSTLTALRDAVPVAIGIVGVVIGAVIAGMAVVAAFMDGIFIRKIRLIEKQPRRYLAPFALTALLGVIGGLSLVVLGSLPHSGPRWLFGVVGGVAGLFTIWAISSIIPLLGSTIEFIDLKGDAAAVPDSFVADRIVDEADEDAEEGDPRGD